MSAFNIFGFFVNIRQVIFVFIDSAAGVEVFIYSDLFIKFFFPQVRNLVFNGNAEHRNKIRK